MSNWIDLPKELDGLDAMLLRPKLDSLLIRDEKNNVVHNYKGIEMEWYEDIIEELNIGDSYSVKMKIIFLANNSENYTRIGQKPTEKIDGVDNKFSIFCQECEGETIFQVQGLYTGKHAKCTICGQHASTIINNCSCDDLENSLYVKQLCEEKHSCYKCDKELY